jgi:hypothetical protein
MLISSLMAREHTAWPAGMALALPVAHEAILARVYPWSACTSA